MAGRKFVFGIRELPRPKGHGFVYYRVAPRTDERKLVYLDLYRSDEADLARLFREALETMITFERDAAGDPRDFLANFETENMQPWVEKIFAKAVEEFRAKNAAPGSRQ